MQEQQRVASHIAPPPPLADEYDEGCVWDRGAVAVTASDIQCKELFDWPTKCVLSMQPLARPLLSVRAVAVGRDQGFGGTGSSKLVLVLRDVHRVIKSVLEIGTMMHQLRAAVVVSCLCQRFDSSSLISPRIAFLMLIITPGAAAGRRNGVSGASRKG